MRFIFLILIKIYVYRPHSNQIQFPPTTQKLLQFNFDTYLCLANNSTLKIFFLDFIAQYSAIREEITHIGFMLSVFVKTTSINDKKKSLN